MTPHYETVFVLSRSLLPDMSEISRIEILLFFLLIFIGGFFSSFETAILSLDKLSFKKILKRGGTRSKLLELWTSNQNDFLTGIYVGNNAFNVGAAVLAASVSVDIARLYGYREAYALAVATFLITLFLLLFSEVLPKSIARHNPEKTVMLLATPLHIALLILKPFSGFFSWVSRVVVTATGGETHRRSLNVTEDEIREIINAGEVAGAIEHNEREMIHSIIEFGDTLVKEVMVPRVDMVCVEVQTPMEEILQIMADEKLSRIPVYEENMDTVIGVLHIKNVMNFWRKNIQDMTAIEFITMPYFVPETKKISELLREFQSQRIQMAIVVDEYGGTAGLVTIEDLIEEIVGEIKDEYDDNISLIKKQEDGSYLADAKIEIYLINEQLHLHLPSEEYSTLSGLILWLFKRMPKKGDTITYEDVRFTIIESDRKRIHKVLIQLLPSS
ncbi:hemolysin family protein [bacterium]|nr:hemolysin family protein [bacterium]